MACRCQCCRNRLIMKTEQIHIIETIQAIQGKSEHLKEELVNLVNLSKQQKGCLAYTLYQKKESPRQFTIVMSFQDRVAYEKHIHAPFILEFMQKHENILYRNEGVIEDFYELVR